MFGCCTEGRRPYKKARFKVRTRNLHAAAHLLNIHIINGSSQEGHDAVTEIRGSFVLIR